MYRDIGIYSVAGTLEALITHPIEVLRTRYVNRTQIWRGIRGIYPGIGIQILRLIPERIVFVGSKDLAIQRGYHWYQYTPVVTALQTLISAPFLSWKTARIEGIPLRVIPYGIAPLYLRNLIFGMCLFAVNEELPKYGYHSSVGATLLGVGSGVICSHPLDVIRIAKQSIFRDKSYYDMYNWFLTMSREHGYIHTLWRGCSGRLLVACIGITTLVETTEYLKHNIERS